MYIHINLSTCICIFGNIFYGGDPRVSPLYLKWKVMTWPTTMSCVPMFVHVHMCTCTLTHMYYSNAVYYTCILVQSTSIWWLSCFLYYSPLVLLSAHLLLFVVASQCKFQCFCDLYFYIMLLNCSCVYCIVRNFRGRKVSWISWFQSHLLFMC